MSDSGGGLANSFEKFKTKLGGSFFKSDTIAVGVDLGSSSVKIVELEKKDGVLELKNYAIAHGKDEFIKPGASGVISESAGLAVKKTLDGAKIRCSKVNVAVPSFSSLITTIEIPMMPENEIELIVRTEAPKYIPVKLSDVIYGWQLIEQVVPQKAEKKEEEKNNFSGKKKEEKVHVLIVAIMKEISDQYNKVLSENELSIDSLEIDAFSLTRALVADDPGSYLIMDIGHKVCNMVAVSNKNVLLNRTVDVAGDKVTKVIANSLGVDEQRAEKMKVEKGMKIDSEGINVTTQILSILIGEVQRTKDVLAKKYPTVELQRIILSGGGAKLKGLREFIERETKLEIVVGNPFLNISCPEDIKESVAENGSILAIAMGLAMLGFEDKD